MVAARPDRRCGAPCRAGCDRGRAARSRMRSRAAGVAAGEPPAEAEARARCRRKRAGRRAADGDASEASRRPRSPALTLRATSARLRRLIARPPRGWRHGAVVRIRGRGASAAVDPRAQILERVDDTPADLAIGGTGPVGAVLLERPRREADIMRCLLGAQIACVLDDVGHDRAPWAVGARRLPSASRTRSSSARKEGLWWPEGGGAVFGHSSGGGSHYDPERSRPASVNSVSATATSAVSAFPPVRTVSRIV
jgi:hypothetical protein